MAREQDQASRGHRGLALGTVALLTLAAALAFGRVFAGRAPTLKLCAAALAAVAVAALLSRWNLLLAALVSAALLLVAVGLLVFPHTTYHGLPTRDTLGAIARAAGRVGHQTRVEVAPTEPLRPLLLAAVTAVWTASFSSHTLAVRSGSPILATLPPVALVAFAGVVMNDGARRIYVALFLAAMLALVFVDGLRRVREWGPLRPWPGLAGRRLASPITIRGARRVALVALGVGTLLPGLLPGFGSPSILVLGEGAGAGGGRGRGVGVNPFVSIRATLHQNPPVELFRVRAEQASYWRMLSLDVFDGEVWSSSDLFAEDESTTIEGSGQLPAAAPSVRGEVLEQEVTITRLSSPWLPMAFVPQAVALPHGRIRFDPEAATAVSLNSLEPGLRYRAVSVLPAPTLEQLDRPVDFRSFPLFERYTDLPPDTPAEIFDIAHRLTDGQPTPYRKMLAVQDFLRTFAYDESVSGAHDVRTIVHFLTVGRRGFCQQFAGSMAVLLRALGYPARVAVGFTPGIQDTGAGLFLVTSRNAHSWVEVFFPGHGWVAFEPTPGRLNPVAQTYLEGLRPVRDQHGVVTEYRASESPRSGLGPGGLPIVRDPFLRALPVDPFGNPVFSRPTPVPLEEGGGFPLRPFLLGLESLVGAGLVLPPVGKMAWRRRQLRRSREPRDAVLSVYRVFAGQAADVGVGRAPGETMWEYRARVRGLIPGSDGHLDRLTDLAQRAAYSGRPVPVGEAEEARRAARAAIRVVRRSRGLLRRILGLYRPGV